MAKHVAAAVGEIPPGTRKLIMAGGREIAIFNVAGEVFALLNRCPHEGAPLCRGTLVGLMEAAEPGRYAYSREGEILRCPWHGWEFDIRTGKSHCDPAGVRVRSFGVSVEAGAALVVAYQAETFPITVEEDYLMVEI